MSQIVDPDFVQSLEEGKPKPKSEERPSLVEASASASASLIDEEKTKLIQEIEREKAAPENKYEKFLEKWIDDIPFIPMCNVEILLSTYRAAPDASIFLANLFSAGLPGQAEPLHRMVSDKNVEREDFQVLACEYKDNLLSLIIFMLKCLLKDPDFIDNPSLNQEKHHTFVKRIKKIYKILTNYFIGGPNLSEKSEQDRFPLYKSKYAHLFYKETEETSLFGWFSRGGSIKKRSRKSKRTRKSKALYHG